MSYVNQSIGMNKVQLTAVGSASTAAVIAANGYIDQIIIANTTANAVTGGLKIGSTSGATDICAALTVGANALFTVTDALLLKRFFSSTVSQTLFMDAVAAWNGALLNITVVWGQL